MVKKDNKGSWILIAIIALFGIIILIQTSFSEERYNTAMNAYADVWCQDQTYEGINQTFSLIVSSESGFTTILKNTSNIISCTASNYNPIRDNFKVTCTTTETRHYITGSWLSSENKIECLGEPRYGCFYAVNSYDSTCKPLPDNLQEYQKSQKFEVPM